MAEANEISKGRLVLLTIAIGIAAFIVSLDGLIVNVAIPTISGELGVRTDEGTWIITLFSTASSLFIPVAGWLAFRMGNIRLFIASILLFAFFSFLCGTVRHFSFLLVFRVFQGAAAGILTPLSLAMILLTFPENKRGVAIGLWSFFVFVSPAMGPMLGGWLSDHRWPWLFYINIPLAVMSALMIFFLFRGTKEERLALPHFDWIGIALIFTSLGTLQSALNRGNIDDWFRSPFIVTLFIICGVCFIFFIAWESFHRSPFLYIAQFKSLNFLIASFTVGLSMALIFSSFTLDSLWVQKALGYTPAWAGLTLTPVGFFPIIFYPIMGKIVSKLDLRIWIGMSYLLYAATFFWLSTINTEVTFINLALPRLVQGIGFAMLTVPNSLIALQGVPQNKMIFAFSLFSFTRTIFVGIAIPLAITLWTRRQTFYQWRMIERTWDGNPILERFLQPFSSVTSQSLQIKALANDALETQASTLGLADIYYLYGWIFFVLFFVILFYRFPKKA